MGEDEVVHYEAEDGVCGGVDKDGVLADDVGPVAVLFHQLSFIPE